MGSVRVTHPYHPFYNRVFQVIKIRKVAGSLTLVLQEKERGSFAIEATWTDYFPQQPDALATPDQYISTQALLALCQMCKNVLK